MAENGVLKIISNECLGEIAAFLAELGILKLIETEFFFRSGNERIKRLLEALESVMCDVIKIRLKRRDATRIEMKKKASP